MKKKKKKNALLSVSILHPCASVFPHFQFKILSEIKVSETAKVYVELSGMDKESLIVSENVGSAILKYVHTEIKLNFIFTIHVISFMPIHLIYTLVLYWSRDVSKQGFVISDQVNHKVAYAAKEDG